MEAFNLTNFARDADEMNSKIRSHNETIEEENLKK